MKEQDIKLIRQKLGLTQKQLADIFGYTQAYISAMETGKVEPTVSIMKKLKDLSQTDEHATRIKIGIGNIRPPVIPKLLRNRNKRILEFKNFIKIETKSNPEYGGDFSIHFIFGNEILFFVGDIIGSGVEVAPLSSYLCGWLKGYLSRTETRPDLRSLVDKISEEVNRQEFGVALFLGVISIENIDNGYAVEIESISCGFPNPILIEGPPFAEKRVVKEIGRPLPFGSQIPKTTRLTNINSPFYIIAASDGLLTRLGLLDEELGMNKLIEHFTGFKRDNGLVELFKDSSLKSDDEIGFVISSSPNWDDELTIYVSDSNIEMVYDFLKSKFENWSLDNQHNNGMISAILEAILNSFSYGKNEPKSPVKIRWVKNIEGLRIEIEDEGIPGKIEKFNNIKNGGIEIMQKWFKTVDFRYSDHNTFIVTLFSNLEEITLKK